MPNMNAVDLSWLKWLQDSNNQMFLDIQQYRDFYNGEHDVKLTKTQASFLGLSQDQVCRRQIELLDEPDLGLRKERRDQGPRFAGPPCRRDEDHLRVSSGFRHGLADDGRIVATTRRQWPVEILARVRVGRRLGVAKKGQLQHVFPDIRPGIWRASSAATAP